MKLVESNAKRSSMTHATYEMLKEAVLTCRLAPGQRINVVELAEQTETSVAAMREALSRLTSEDLVVAEPQKGFRIAPISPQDLRDLTEARIEIETLCLRRAAALGDVAWEARMLAAYHTLSRHHESDFRQENSADLHTSWSSVHREFHEALVSACDNRWLLRLRSQLFYQHARYRNLSVSLTASSRDLNSEHKALLDAMLNRDAEHAAQEFRNHLSATAEAVFRHVDADAPVELR